MFTVQEEKSRAISIITGTLNPTLTSTDSAFANNQIVVPKSTTKEITIKLTNNNNRDAKFNFYYIGNLPTGVEVGYISTTKDIPPTTEGTVIQKGKSQEYTIKIKNTNSSSFTLQIGSDGGLFDKDLLFPSNGHFFEEVRKTAVETVLAKVNQETLDYQTASTEQQKEAWTFSHTAGSQQTGWTSEELKDYRYIGNHPNNYITFNDEMWRIIGVFTVEDENGKKEQHLKIVRDDLLGSSKWNAGDSSTMATQNDELKVSSLLWTNRKVILKKMAPDNPDNLSTNWPDASLQKLLNGYYYNRSGYYSDRGLLEKSRVQIADIKWYLGGVEAENSVVSQYYLYERGTSIFEGNALSWIGKVGLLYPSDYGYATAGGIARSRLLCLQTPMASWGPESSLGNYQSIYDDCRTNDWLYKSQSEWTITHRSSEQWSVMSIWSLGTVRSDIADNPSDISFRPVVFLKSDIQIISGDGSSTNPYILSE